MRHIYARAEDLTSRVEEAWAITDRRDSMLNVFDIILVKAKTCSTP